MKTDEPKEKKHLPTVTAGLDKRKQLANGKYNAALIIAFNYKRKHYPITSDGGKLQLDPKKDMNETTKKPKNKEIKGVFEDAIHRAKEIIKNLPVFTFESFEAEYFTDVSKTDDHVVGALKERAKQLHANGQLKTALGYETTASRIDDFVNKDRLEFHQVTVKWLNDFEKYLIKPYKKGKKMKPGRSFTTVGIYLRNLRAVIRPHLTGAAYPFGPEKDGKYEIPGSRNIKKALALDDVAKIYNFDAPAGSDIQYQRDLWLLSYLCNGANIKDLARLKYRNIDQDNITFIRSKTASTKRKNQQVIEVPLTKEIARIIDRWSVPGTIDDFVLPILKPGLTGKQELNRIELTVKQVNRTMRRIAKDTDIGIDVTTYSARHSFATILMRSGATVAMISKALGHSTVNTTANYLADFDQETKREFAEKLTDFKKTHAK